MRLLLVVGVAFMISIGMAGVARADDPLTGAQCLPAAESCDVWAGTHASPPRPPTGTLRPMASGTGDNGLRVCYSAGVARPVPCVDPEYGWLADDGCYYKPAPDFEPMPVLAAQVEPGVDGSWYAMECLGMSTGSGVIWRRATGIAGLMPPIPAVLAQQARSRLVLPAPRVRSSPVPGVPQLVGLPVWLWVDAASWRPQSTTAAVPGAAVTATAMPVELTWRLGDGSTVVCHGPGTPYPADGVDPATASPSCGHTFTRSSAAEPGQAFRGSVMVTWSVTWAGGGQGGVFPVLTQTTPITFQVAESQAVTLPGPSAGK